MTAERYEMLIHPRALALQRLVLHVICMDKPTTKALSAMGYEIVVSLRSFFFFLVLFGGAGVVVEVLKLYGCLFQAF